MTRVLVLALSLLVARTAAADVILQTAVPGVPSFGGLSVESSQYLAARFHLDVPMQVTEVGGHIGGNGSLFFAIVRVANGSAFPAGARFNDDEVAWSRTFTASMPTSDVLIPASTVLVPGDYMIVAGSGHFGATGSGIMPNSAPIGSQQFYYNPGSGWLVDPAVSVRFLINGVPDTHEALMTAVNSRSSQASVDALTTMVTSANVALAGKASQASVDAISGTLATKASQVSVDTANTALAAKASQASVDAIDSSIDGVAASVGALATEQHLTDVSSSLGTAIGSRASAESVAELSAKVDTLTSGPTRLEIERAIATGARILTLMLPAVSGGHLETVRDILVEAIASAQAAGLPVNKASIDFAKGDSAGTAGDFRSAYDWYVSAYQKLLK